MLLNTQLVFLASHYIIHDRLLIAWTNIIAMFTKQVQNSRFARYARYARYALFRYFSMEMEFVALWGLMQCVPYNPRVSLDLVMLCAGNNTSTPVAQGSRADWLICLVNDLKAIREGVPNRRYSLKGRVGWRWGNGGEGKEGIKQCD